MPTKCQISMDHMQITMKKRKKLSNNLHGKNKNQTPG